MVAWRRSSGWYGARGGRVRFQVRPRQTERCYPHYIVVVAERLNHQGLQLQLYSHVPVHPRGGNIGMLKTWGPEVKDKPRIDAKDIRI